MLLLHFLTIQSKIKPELHKKYSGEDENHTAAIENPYKQLKACSMRSVKNDKNCRDADFIINKF